jgi:hypothetical protein
MSLDRETIAVIPNSIYGSYEEAYSALLVHGERHGYGFRVRRSKPHNQNIKTHYYYCCDREGKHGSKATIKDGSSRRIGCPFKLVIFRKDERQWEVKVNHPDHNHGPSANPKDHNVFRRRNHEQKEYIESMRKAGIRPKQMLSSIEEQYTGSHITISDIYTEINTLKARSLSGRTPIEVLFDRLSEPSSGFVYDFQIDSENHVQNLFFAHDKQVRLLLANPDIILMDCTYRTNKFKIPLLHVVGCTSMQTFFSAGFCFLRNETRQNYYWAISAFFRKTGLRQPNVYISDQEDSLKSAFGELFPGVPQLLCIWHINKNVQTRAQQTWRDADGKTLEEKQAIIEKRSHFMSRWNQLVYAKTVDVFMHKWNRLLYDYCDQRALCDYLRECQYPTRIQWACAWTSAHRHYGTITTSPLEGMHKVLKEYLGNSSGDLLYVVERLTKMVSNQYSKYEKDITSARSRRKATHKKFVLFPDNIFNVVSRKALDFVYEQEIKRQSDIKDGNWGFPCSGCFQNVYGLPCRHELQNLHATGSKLGLQHFEDDHWRYECRDGHSIRSPAGPHQHLQDPIPVQGRGRPRNDVTSTRRDPSSFELPVPPSRPLITLTELLRQTETTRKSSTPIQSPASSQTSQLTKSEDVAELEVEPETERVVLSLEEFLEEVERRKQQPQQRDRAFQDPFTFADHLERTGQWNYAPELVHAFQMAITEVGMFAHFTPTMAYNFYFNREVYDVEREAQRQEEEVDRLPKRRAAQMASNAWAGLSPKKRARRR